MQQTIRVDDRRDALRVLEEETSSAECFVFSRGWILEHQLIQSLHLVWQLDQIGNAGSREKQGKEEEERQEVEGVVLVCDTTA